MKTLSEKSFEARGIADVMFGVLLALGGVYFVAHVAAWATRGFSFVK